MNERLYDPPVETGDVPLPVLDGAPGPRSGEPELPRILLQAAASRLAERRLLLLTGIFVLFSLVEGLLVLGMPAPEPLVVYATPAFSPLVEQMK